MSQFQQDIRPIDNKENSNEKNNHQSFAGSMQVQLNHSSDLKPIQNSEREVQIQPPSIQQELSNLLVPLNFYPETSKINFSDLFLSLEKLQILGTIAIQVQQQEEDKLENPCKSKICENEKGPEQSKNPCLVQPEPIFASLQGSVSESKQMSSQNIQPINQKEFVKQIFGGNEFISFEGYIKNNVRVGEWSFIYQREQIGKGTYNESGQKMGEWTEPDEVYSCNYQIIYHGKYKNDIKYGYWITLSKGIIMGGGFYTESGIKQGEWKEIYRNKQKLIFLDVGEYQNGMKTSFWITYHKGQGIGVSNYENGMKLNEQIEILENYDSKFRVTECGSCRHDKRIKLWVIILNEKIIGGGYYTGIENQITGKKNGPWTEPDLNPKFQGRVTMNGNYFEGIKQGYWAVCIDGSEIDGGQYNEKGIKIGNWGDLDQINISNFNNQTQNAMPQEFENRRTKNNANSYLKKSLQLDQEKEFPILIATSIVSNLQEHYLKTIYTAINSETS